MIKNRGFSERSLQDFVLELGSKAPVPGGGGAAALTGAVGTALGDMVACLTIGKPKYKEFEDEFISLKEKAEQLENELLDLIQKDADVFKPLAEAYKIGPGPEMEKALKGACEVPLLIMEKCADAILLHKEFAAKGSRLAISDAGAGAILCSAAMKAASLNVFINISSIEDKKYIETVEKKASGLLKEYEPLADEIFKSVKERL